MQKVDQKIPIIFILSRGHSGSTLLDMMLNAHPEITGLGECEKAADKFFSDQECACGEKLKSCSFWSNLSFSPAFFNARVRKIYRGKIDTILGKNNFSFRKKGASTISTAVYLHEQERFFEYVKAKTDGTYLVDSSKNIDRLVFLLNSKTIKPIAIHLVRDGRGVLGSYTRKFGFRLSHIFEWLSYNLKAAYILKRKNIKTIFVHYEALVNHPEIVLEAVCQKLSLSYDDGMLRPSKAEHHQVGGNMKVYFNTINVQPDKTWKKKLTWWQVTLFNLIGGWLNWWYYYRARR